MGIQYGCTISIKMGITFLSSFAKKNKYKRSNFFYQNIIIFCQNEKVHNTCLCKSLESIFKTFISNIYIISLLDIDKGKNKTN